MPTVVAEWMNATAAGALIGTDAKGVARLAARGLIRVRPLPVRNRYATADVVRLSREAGSLAGAPGTENDRG